MSKPFIPTVVPAVVGEATAGEAQAARKALEELIDGASRSNFDIAEQCHLIKSRGWYYPYTTFQEYAKSLTKMKARKIQYLTRMAGVFEQVGVSRAEYEPLGIARCREITSLDPGASWVNPAGESIPVSEFIKGFVDKGEALEIEDLKRHVRTLKGFVGDKDLVWVNLCLQRGVHENVYVPAIEKAKALIGSVAKDDEGISQDASDAAAVEVILANFNADDTIVQSVKPVKEEEFEEVDDAHL